MEIKTLKNSVEITPVDTKNFIKTIEIVEHQNIFVTKSYNILLINIVYSSMGGRG